MVNLFKSSLKEHWKCGTLYTYRIAPNSSLDYVNLKKNHIDITYYRKLNGHFRDR